MGFFSKATAVTVLLALTQYSTAAPSGSFRHLQRQDANALAISTCHASLQNVTLNTTSLGSGNYVISGLSASCMTVATIITGVPNVGNPYPTGVDSIQYNSINETTLTQIQNGFKGVTS